MIYSVSIAYPEEKYPELDNVLSKIAHAREYDSGIGFGERDMSFDYRHFNTAFAAFTRLRKCRQINSISLSIAKDV